MTRGGYDFFGKIREGDLQYMRRVKKPVNRTKLPEKALENIADFFASTTFRDAMNKRTRHGSAE